MTEIGVGDRDDLTSPRVERDLSDIHSLETTDDLCSLLSIRDTHSRRLTAECLPERKLEAKLARVNVETVQSQANARRDIRSNLCKFLSKRSGIIVSTASKLNVESGSYQ